MVVLSFSNNVSKLTMNSATNILNYLGKNEKITKIHCFKKDLGKIETDQLIVKWSENECFIYDKLGSITFMESLKKVEDEFSITSTETSRIYYISKDLKVKLIEKNNEIYIDFNGIVEKAEKIYKRGIYTIYETRKGNKFESSNSSCRFNNLAISEIQS